MLVNCQYQRVLLWITLFTLLVWIFLIVNKHQMVLKTIFTIHEQTMITHILGIITQVNSISGFLGQECVDKFTAYACAYMYVYKLSLGETK